MSRRRLIAAIGAAAGAAALAARQAPPPAHSARGASRPGRAATGRAGPPTPSRRRGEAGRPAGGGKAFNGAYPYELPPAGHWNGYVPKNTNVGIYQDLMEQPLGMYYWGTGKWMPLLATEWKTLPPDKFEVTLRQGVKWSRRQGLHRRRRDDDLHGRPDRELDASGATSTRSRRRATRSRST